MKIKHKQRADFVTGTDIVRLITTLCGIVLFLLPFVYAKFSVGTQNIMHICGYVLWGFLAVDSAYKIVRMNKEERTRFLKIHKTDLLFCAATVVLLPVSIIMHIYWPAAVLILKFAASLLPFDDEKTFQLFTNIISVLLIAFYVIPLCNVLAVSLSSPDQIVNIFPKNIDLYSVKYVLTDSRFFHAMGISVFVTAVGTVLTVITVSMAAYPLSKPQIPFRRTMMMFFIIIMLFNGGMAPSILLMNYLHLNNTVWALIFPSVVQVFYLILLKGFFEDIPAELEESARLDGANNYTILFRIVFPISAPMLATVALFTLVSYWNNFYSAILYVTSREDLYPLPMYIRNFLNSSPLNIAMENPTLVAYWDNVKMSYILFSIVPVLIAYPFTFKYLKNGVSMGAVKG